MVRRINMDEKYEYAFAESLKTVLEEAKNEGALSVYFDVREQKAEVLFSVDNFLRMVKGFPGSVSEERLHRDDPFYKYRWTYPFQNVLVYAILRETERNRNLEQDWISTKIARVD
jgi:hypothetical protein